MNMGKLARTSTLVLCCILSCLGFFPLQAQDCPSPPDSEKIILDAMNRLRLSQGLVLLVPNETLRQVACDQALYLGRRSNTSLGDTYLRQDEVQGRLTSLDDWLGNTDYGLYPDVNNAYKADVLVYVGFDHSPTTIIDAANARPPTFLSWRAKQRGDEYLPFYSNFYREVGIAYIRRDGAQRNQIVIVFGAQPGVLPVSISQASSPSVIIPDGGEVSDVQLILNIHDELNPTVDRTIGSLIKIRVSESQFPEESDQCSGDGWTPYVPEFPYELSGGLGLKTIHIQLCDGFFLTDQTTITVNLINYSPSIPLAESPTFGTSTETTTNVVGIVPTVVMPSLTALPTNTPAPTFTPTPTPTELPTNTPSPTSTPTQLPTNTPSPTPTPTQLPTNTPTLPPTFTPSPQPIGANMALRLAWQQTYLVISNPASNGASVDLSPLQFTGNDGTVYRIGDGLDQPATIHDVQPDDCVVLYSYVAQQEAPSIDAVRRIAFCNRVVDYIPIYNGRVFWALTGLGDFHVAFNGQSTICQPSKNQSCEVTPDAAPAPTPEGNPMTEVRAFWNGEIFVVLNEGPGGADVSNLSFASEQTGLEPSRWAMEHNLEAGEDYELSNMRPGSCLIAYASNEQPALPLENLCNRIIGRAILSTTREMFWAQGAFTPYINKTVPGEICQGGTNCIVKVPAARP